LPFLDRCKRLGYKYESDEKRERKCTYVEEDPQEATFDIIGVEKLFGV
jgi:hypothetical protein